MESFAKFIKESRIFFSDITNEIIKICESQIWESPVKK